MSKNLINVEMPDGTIIEGIPEGTSQSEVIRRYSTATRPPAGAPNPAVAEMQNRMTPEDALAAPGTQSAIRAGEGFAIPSVGLQTGKTLVAKAGAALPTAEDVTSRLYNRAAAVKGGKDGVRVSMSTGAVQTDPGRAMVRSLADEGKTGLGQMWEGMKAHATADPASNVTRVRAYRELQKTGQAIENELGKSSASLELDLPHDIPKAVLASDKVGVAMDPLTGRVTVSPSQAHKLRSAIGDEINWSRDAIPTPANEALKETWTQIGDMIDNAVPTVKPLRKPWQEAYLYTKNFGHQLENAVAGKATPPSFARATLKNAGKAAIAGTALGGAYKILN